MTQHRQRFPAYLDYRSDDDSTLREFKEAGRQLVKFLRQHGARRAWIDSVQLDIGAGSAALTTTVSRKLPKRSREGKLTIETTTLARLRWLIENHREHCYSNPRYREIRLAVESEEKGFGSPSWRAESTSCCPRTNRRSYRPAFAIRS